MAVEIDAVLGVDRHDLLAQVLAQLDDGALLTLNPVAAGTASARQIAAAHGLQAHVSTSADVDVGAAILTTPHGEHCVHLRPSGEGAGVRTIADLIDAIAPGGVNPSSRRGDDGVFAGRRMAWVTNLPAPYRIPLFERIHARMQACGGSYRVFLQQSEAPDRPWIRLPDEPRFEHEVMRSREIRVRERAPLLTLDLERALSRYRPDVVVSAGLSPLVSGRAAVWCRRKSVPFGLFTGDIASSSTAASRRDAFRAWLVARTDFAIAYGFEAGEYIRTLAPLPFVYSRNTSFVADPGERPAGDRPVHALAVGDMHSDRKGHDVLIDALREVPALECRLTLIGGGSRIDALRERAAGDTRIHFTGPLPAEQVRALYGEADLFLFPTRFDVYGLALVEAMGSGLASISSDRGGVVADIVSDRNCRVLDSLDPGAWARAIEALCADAQERRRLGAAARRTVLGRWSLDHSADSVIAGLRLGLSLRRR